MTSPWDALRRRLDGGQVLTPADAGPASARFHTSCWFDLDSKSLLLCSGMSVI
jgi:hypothetical protein